MKRFVTALFALAVLAGFVPVPAFGPQGPKPEAATCCGSKSCCEAAPPCPDGGTTCALAETSGRGAPAGGAQAAPAGSAGTLLKSAHCGGSAAFVTGASVDPTLGPGVAYTVVEPEAAENLTASQRRAMLRAAKPAVPPPRA